MIGVDLAAVDIMVELLLIMPILEAVALHLYQDTMDAKLLKEEIAGEEQTMPELDIRVNAYIPDRYMESNVTRMDAYKEIAELLTVEEESEFRRATEDAYGALPEEADSLIDIAMVKRMAMKLGVREVVINNSVTKIVFGEFKAFANSDLQRAMDEYGDSVMVNMAKEPAIEFSLIGEKSADRLKVVRKFMQSALS